MPSFSDTPRPRLRSIKNRESVYRLPWNPSKNGQLPDLPTSRFASGSAGFQVMRVILILTVKALTQTFLVLPARGKASAENFLHFNVNYLHVVFNYMYGILRGNSPRVLPGGSPPQPA